MKDKMRTGGGHAPLTQVRSLCDVRDKKLREALLLRGIVAPHMLRH